MTPSEALSLALDALEYHAEQTRPIHSTQNAIAVLRAELRTMTDQAQQSLTVRSIELMPTHEVMWIWERAANLSDVVNEVVRLRQSQEIVRSILLAYVALRDHGIGSKP